jgi:predicted esterase
VCAEANKDWRQHLREIAETESFIDELAEQYGIDPSRIAFKNFKSGAITAAKETAAATAESAGSANGDTKEETVDA